MITLAAIRRSRRVVLVAAALVAPPLALLSFVMLIPLLTASGIIGAPPIAAIVVGTALGVGAFVLLFAAHDPVCWTKLRSGNFRRGDGRGVRARNTTRIDLRDMPPGAASRLFQRLDHPGRRARVDDALGGAVAVPTLIAPAARRTAARIAET